MNNEDSLLKRKTKYEKEMDREKRKIQIGVYKKTVLAEERELRIRKRKQIGTCEPTDKVIIMPKKKKTVSFYIKDEIGNDVEIKNEKTDQVMLENNNDINDKGKE